MNFFEFLKKFPSESAIVKYYIKIRYKNTKPFCNHCKSNKTYHYNNETKIKFFRCGSCGKDFSIFKGTIFEKSCTDLRKWFYAIHLILNAKKGISGLQLQREIAVTYKTAWRMLNQIRKAMSNKDDNDSGLGEIVEMDECYIGGKSENKRMSKRIELKGKDDKAVVFGILERQGELRAYHIEDAKYYSIAEKVLSNVKIGSTIITDEFKSYQALKTFYNHLTINHSKGEYVKQDKELKLYTNSIENVWGTLKRGIIGIYHHVSKKHLQGYINEFCFRYNNRGNIMIFDNLIKNSIC